METIRATFHKLIAKKIPTDEYVHIRHKHASEEEQLRITKGAEALNMVVTDTPSFTLSPTVLGARIAAQNIPVDQFIPVRIAVTKKAISAAYAKASHLEQYGSEEVEDAWWRQIKLEKDLDLSTQFATAAEIEIS